MKPLTGHPPTRPRRAAGMPWGRGPALAAAMLLHAVVLPAPAAVQKAPDNELRVLLKKAIEDGGGFTDRFQAEVWLMDMSGRLKDRLPDDRQRLRLLKLVHTEAMRAGLSPQLVLAVIDVESGFDRFAISRSGARGLMQVMPFWLREIGHPEDNLFHAQTNLRLGCTILRYYLDREGGDLRRALARYNGSIGKRDYADKIFEALTKRWFKQ